MKKRKKKILIILTMLITVMLGITAFAWFVMNSSVGADGLDSKIASWDFIISLTPGGAPIGDNEKVEINVDSFLNVKEGKMAPGTTGTITLYARTSSDTIASALVYLDVSSLMMKDNADNDISDILKKHLVFYGDSSFTNIVDMDNPVSFDVEKDVEKTITIYWKWPYEGDEIMPDNITDDDEIAAFLRQYDEEDCLISEYRNNITGNIEVSVVAVNKQPVANQ